MASEFRYEGIENNQHKFIEISTGVASYWSQPESTVTMLDGDLVEFSNLYGNPIIWSIRQRCQVGWGTN